MQTKFENNVLTIMLEGKIDSLNAPKVEEEIDQVFQEKKPEKVVLDCENLEYTTSAGLRVILRIKQKVDDTSIINVQSAVYEIFDMTGFTEMMEIHKAYRVISVDGCEVIGQGANGKVFRIDRDTIVKVYLNPDSLDEINRERELARTAFVLGVPTAIPYDVVRIESGGYGSVFELLNALSYAKLLISGEKSVDELAEMSIDLLKLIHSKVVKPEKMNGIKNTALDWVAFMKDQIPADQFEKLYGLVEAVPDDLHMLHGDYHLKNVMYQNGESLLIDMDTLAHGHPIFELAAMYNAYQAFSAVDHKVIEGFLGISYETGARFWRRSLELYLGTTNDSILQDVESKAKVISFTRLMRRTLRWGDPESDTDRAAIAYYRAALAELLPRTDTLLF